MLDGILLIILGILAVPSLLLSKKPNAKELLDKIAPFQGIIGVIFCLWGIFTLIGCILGLSWLTAAPIYWITWLLVAIVEMVLGFLLGYGLIAKYALSKNEAAKAKGEQLLAKLAPMQGKFGIVAIILGIWMIIAYMLWFIV